MVPKKSLYFSRYITAIHKRNISTFSRKIKSIAKLPVILCGTYKPQQIKLQSDKGVLVLQPLGLLFRPGQLSFASS